MHKRVNTSKLFARINRRIMLDYHCKYERAVEFLFIVETFVTSIIIIIIFFSLYQTGAKLLEIRREVENK